MNIFRYERVRKTGFRVRLTVQLPASENQKAHKSLVKAELSLSKLAA